MCLWQFGRTWYHQTNSSREDLNYFSSSFAIGRSGEMTCQVLVEVSYPCENIHDFEELYLSGISVTSIFTYFVALLLFCSQSCLLQSVFSFRKWVQVKHIGYGFSSDTWKYQVSRYSSIIWRLPMPELFFCLFRRSDFPPQLNLVA